MAYDISDLQSFGAQMAQSYGVPTDLFMAQIGQESSWNPAAKNGNATGIAQFMPGTAKDFGLDPTDPYASLQAAAKYDAQLYQKTGSWASVMNSYGTTAGGNAPTVASLASQYDQGTLIGSAPGISIYVPKDAGMGGTTLGSNPNALGGDTSNPSAPTTGTPGVDSILGNLTGSLKGAAIILLGIVLIILALVLTNKGQQAIKVVTAKA